jgi:thiamine-phosphate pyrophosphorylase
MKNLYALCDMASLDKKQISLESFLDIAKAQNAKIIQYRDKINTLEIQKNNLLYLKQHTTIKIIINDKLELLEYCDGIHLGQEDLFRIKTKELKLSSDKMVFELLKKKYPEKIFGISTHNELEILHANKLPLDYIGLGAYRATSTKNVENILGDKISYLAKMSKHKVGAIGAVTFKDNIENIYYNVISSDLLKLIK